MEVPRTLRLRGQKALVESCDRYVYCSFRRCQKSIRKGVLHLVVRNRKGEVKGRFCNVSCQEGKLREILSTRTLRRV